MPAVHLVTFPQQLVPLGRSMQSGYRPAQGPYPCITGSVEGSMAALPAALSRCSRSQGRRRSYETMIRRRWRCCCRHR